jgi:hypothetical protein
MVSTNSRAISAACHVLEEDEKYGYLLPVKWGVVQRQNGVGRCAMSTAYDIKMPNPALCIVDLLREKRKWTSDLAILIPRVVARECSG